MAGQIDVSGAMRQLRRFGEDAKREVKETNRDAAKIVEVEARSLVPVRSGRLQASIRSSGQLGRGVVRAGKKSVPYAGPIHYGWPSRPRRKWGIPGRTGGGPFGPQPFLEDAVSNERQKIIRLYQTRLEAIARKHSG